MKQLLLKSMTLTNFKGIRNLKIEFSPTSTGIYGRNSTGKTTIMDGFNFLLFGKDSTDRKDFSVKTLDENNQAIHKLDHEVTAVITIDNMPVTLKRCLREKWTTRRGSDKEEFTGHETLFWVDDVPMQAGEYQSRIDSYINELVFKMITSPHYFNSLKWQDRRQVLINLVGEVKDSDIAKTKPAFKELMELLAGKSFDEFRKSIAEKKKRLKDDLSLIPARIDEVTRQKPVEPDYKALELVLKQNQSLIADVDGQLNDALKLSEAILEKEKTRQSKIYALKGQLSTIEFNVKEKAYAGTRERDSKVRALKTELEETDRAIETQSAAIKSNDLKIEYAEKKIAELRQDWNTENAKTLTFDPEKFNCPTCKRPYEPSDVETQKEEMTANFNRAKLDKCKSIQANGLELTNQVSELKKDSNSRLDKITVLKDWKAEIEKDLANNSNREENPVIDLDADPEYTRIKAEIETLEAETYKPADNSELRAKKAELQTRIDDLKRQLSVKDSIDRANDRIKELETEAREKSQLLADLERQEFIMTDFEQTKMTQIEQRVNGMFTMVKFKMFNTLINGGIEPTCETLINGVPWNDANNAGRINAGIDIINTLCSYYQVSAPVFVDNSEAVCDLLTSVSQVIRLVVSPKDKVLRFDTAKEMAESV